MPEGIRKEKNLPERISRSLIQNEAQFIQSLKIFANTSIVGAQGAQSGGSSGGPSGVGNYLRKDGDIMDGVFATRPTIATIAAGEIDISKLTAKNYSSHLYIIPETGTSDDLNFIFGGSSGSVILGSEFPGQWLIIQPIAGATITINNDLSGFGDPAATPKRNIRTPDGNPVILKNEQAVLLNFDTTSGQWAFLGAPGTAISGDSCFPELDEGDVSGALTIFFNRNRFVRMRVTGNTNIAFDASEMIFGCWYQLTLEILQDPGGGNSVTFDEAPFENQVTPKVYTAGNRYTSIRFYAYLNDTNARIFAFDEFQPFPTEFFDSFIQARLTTDQTANFNPNNHIEFNLPIATDNTISVSTGSGQAAGKFTNFKIGHLYQCEVVAAIEASNEAEMSYQWYNVTKGSFFGSQARALTVNHSEFDSSLAIAKGFFVADAINDTVEVRIKSQDAVDSIKAGDQSAEQMTYVIIKDCGVAGIENLEGNIVPAPEPTGPDTFGTRHLFVGNYATLGTAGFQYHLGFNGALSNGGVADVHLPAMRPGNFVRVMVSVTFNPSVAGTTVYTKVGSTLSQVGVIGAGVTGFFEFAASQSFNLEERASVVFIRSDSNGAIEVTGTFEVAFDLSGEKLLIGVYGILGGNAAQYANIVAPPARGVAGPGQHLIEEMWTRTFEKAGIIKEIWHWGSAGAGTGNFDVGFIKNGVLLPSTLFNVPVKGSETLHKFTDVNISFNAGDKIAWYTKPRGGSANTYSLMARIELT